MQQSEQRVAGLLDPVPQTRERCGILQAKVRLFRPQRGDARGRRSRSLVRNHVSHGATVYALRLRVHNLEPVLLEQVTDRGEREIEGVLIVNLVVGRLLHDVAQIWILENQDAIGLQKDADAFGYRVQIRDMTHDVRTQKRIGLTVLGYDLPGQIFIEELGYRADTSLARNGSYIR